MTLEIIIVVVSIVLAGGTTGAIIYWDDVLSFFKWKRIAILGDQETGKTTLFTFLLTGELITEYMPTRGSEKTPQKRFPMKDLELKVKESLDVSGSSFARDQWRKIALEADIIIYLTRIDLLLSKDINICDRIIKDAVLIAGWLKDHYKTSGIKKSCVLIGTFADKVNDYNPSDGRSVQTLDALFQGNETLKVVARNLRSVTSDDGLLVFIGSMETKEQTSALAETLLKRLGTKR